MIKAYLEELVNSNDCVDFHDCFDCGLTHECRCDDCEFDWSPVDKIVNIILGV